MKAETKRPKSQIPRLGPVRLLFIGVMLVVAVVSGLAAFSASFGRFAPSLALGLWPPSGTVYAGASTGIFSAAVDPKSGVLPKDLPDEMAKLARQAISLEPTDVTAMRNLGFYYVSKDQTQRARQMMDAALKTSRRNSAVNLWLTQNLAEKGDSLDALRLYDLTIRTDTGAATSLMMLMAQQLQDPNLLPAFKEFLEKDPPWMSDFWTSVLNRGGDLTNAFKLRSYLHSRGVKMVSDHDAMLISRLANSGKLEEAFALYGEVGGKLQQGSELLVDGNFSAGDPYPPIGWKVVTEGSYGAMIDAKTGQLAVTALSGQGGTAAQQLIKLGRGGTFRAQADYEGGTKHEPLELHLVCAELKGARTLDQTIELPAGEPVITSFSTPCRYAWASIVLPDESGSSARDIRISSISLRRIG